MSNSKKSAMTEKSRIQQLFAGYADDQYLSGEAVVDDDGTELQSAAWLYENRYDDFLDEMSSALVSEGVSRDALMRMYIHHALRVLNENPDSTHVAACSKDNENTRIVIDELIKHRQDRESLKAKVVAFLPVPTVICDDPPPGRKH